MKLLKWQIFFIDKGKTVVKLEKGKDTEAIQTSNDSLKEDERHGYIHLHLK